MKFDTEFFGYSLLISPIIHLFFIIKMENDLKYVITFHKIIFVLLLIFVKW